MVLQDEVGHDAWGSYGALLSFAFLFVTLADLGINNYTTKTLAEAPERLRTDFPHFFSAKMLLTLIYPVILGGLGWLIGYRGQELEFLMLLCLVLGGMQIAEFIRANFRAKQRFTLDSYLSVFDRLLLMGAVAYMLMRDITIGQFIYARVLVVSVVIVCFYVLLMRVYGWIKPQLNFKAIGKVIQMSWGFALMTILYSLHDKLDQVMLERLYSKAQNGLYYGAYRWLDAFSMYLWTVLPIFFARFAFLNKQPKEKERLLHFGQIITALPMIFVGVFIWFHGEQLLFLFEESTPAEIETMRLCLQALFVAAIMNGVFAIFSTLLTSTGHEKNVNIMVLLSIIPNIGLNFWLIPQYGAVAAAWTTVVSYSLLNVLYVLYIQQKLEIAVPWLQMVKLFSAAAMLFVGFWALGQTSLTWYWISLIAGFSFLAYCYLIGLISWKMLKSF